MTISEMNVGASVSQQTIPSAIAQLRNNFNAGLTRTLSYRQSQLKGLERFLKEQEQTIIKAIQQDMHRAAIEVYAAEIALTLTQLTLTRNELAAWMKPERVHTPWMAQPAKSRIYHEPLGVVLIISPWNYPLQLLLTPLIGAIAAGNCVVCKPSELAPATSALLATQLPRYLDANTVSVITGGVPETTALLEERFDHIFYSGNGRVAKIILTAAAKHLTPVTLELGGKNPCIVDKSTNLASTARRILWGKFYNNGQTCIAPDYVLVHEKIAEQLIFQLQQTLEEFYGKDPQESRDYGRIINTHHFQRLRQLLSHSGTVIAGGKVEEKERYIAPTLLIDVPEDEPIMLEEIFGPILPIIKINDIKRAIAFINARPKSLALYLFSDDKNVQQQVIAQTSSGGITVNHIGLHFVVPKLPFGGVGASGMGAYHGKATFETFSHRKSTLIKSSGFDASFLYPPYNAKKNKWLRWIL